MSSPWGVSGGATAPIFGHGSNEDRNSIEGLHVAMVCPDLIGPVRNGGIGTANSHLAFSLAESGARVSILLTEFGWNADCDDRWLAEYESAGICVERALVWWGKREGCRATYPNHPDVLLAHIADSWLREMQSDLAICNDWGGHGFYALHARRSGIAHGETPVVLITHSPTLWHDLSSPSVVFSEDTIVRYLLERKSVELADALVSPSAYMLSWLTQHGFEMPNHQFVQPNVLRLNTGRRWSPEGLSSSENVVFFGRLEDRKGLAEFCDAMDVLMREGKLPAQVTFLGKPGFVEGQHALVYLECRTRAWSCQIEILPDLDQPAALEHLVNNAGLAVIPSRSDNSPYALYECLALNIPVLTRDTGGARELVDDRDWSHALYNGTPEELAQSISHVMKGESRASRLAFDLHDNEMSWISLVAHLGRLGPVSVPEQEEVRISVCLAHRNRPRELEVTLAALESQTDHDFELVIVDDGSDTTESLRMLDQLPGRLGVKKWRVVRAPHRNACAARNRAATLATGSHLLFVDDDNMPGPQMIEQFKKAAKASRADLIVCAFDVVEFGKESLENIPKERYLPLGDAVALAMRHNYIGDTNSLVRRDMYTFIGGFTEEFGHGHEDFELFLRLLLAGASTAVIPDPLFQYRRHANSISNTTNMAENRRRTQRLFVQHWPAASYEMALLSASAIPHPGTHLNPALSSAADLLRARELGGSDPGSLRVIQAAASLPWSRGAEGNRRLITRGTSSSSGARFELGHLSSLQLLESLTVEESPDRVREAASALLQTGSQDLVLHLAVCEMFALRGFVADALRVLGRAVGLVSSAYVAVRPDIARAVRSGEVASALDHFVNFGRHEGLVWPHPFIFGALWALCEPATQSGNERLSDSLSAEFRRLGIAVGSHND